MTNRNTIGFDRTIRLAWLDAVSAKVAQGASDADIHAFLWQYLEGSEERGKANTATGKTITVLRHVWSRVPAECMPLRNRAISILKQNPLDQHVGVHWAMCVATYPFFADVTSIVGRLLRLQTTVTSQQIYRRLKELWGDRSTVRRAGQRVISSLVLWNALREAGKQGEFELANGRIEINNDVSLLLFEAVLCAGASKSLPASELERHPSLFAFSLSLDMSSLRCAPHLHVSRQGLDMDIVSIQEG